MVDAKIVCKGKGKVKIKFSIEKATKAQKGSRRTDLPFLLLRPRPGRFTPGKDLV
jgi:hypothetical protein